VFRYRCQLFPFEELDSFGCLRSFCGLCAFDACGCFRPCEGFDALERPEEPGDTADCCEKRHHEQDVQPVVLEVLPVVGVDTLLDGTFKDEVREDELFGPDQEVVLGWIERDEELKVQDCHERDHHEWQYLLEQTVETVDRRRSAESLIKLL